MSPSFRRIDYSLRPAKHAERRMLCEIFRKASPFGRIEEYTYVGFGSVWFADFALFHRALGVRDMISIERSKEAQERFEDNKPFQIKMDFRPSTQALHDLDWSRNQFLWLDYDDPLSCDMLLDMRTVTRRARSGTILAVSVQCSTAPQVAEAEQDSTVGAPSSLDRFIDAFGRERVPHQTSAENLYGWLYGALSRSILFRELNAELAVRNSGGQEDEMHFRPVCEFEYEDGAKMTTVVGVFHSASDQAKFEACHFEALEFLPAPIKAVRIEIPKLTAREFKKIESQLPLPPDGELQVGTIPLNEANRFREMYRYLPNFAVIEG